MYHTKEEMKEFKLFKGDYDAYLEYLENKNDVTALDIISTAVCSQLRLPLAQVVLPSRKRELVFARQVIHWFGYYFTTVTLSTIGSKAGGLDHVTVLYSKDNIDDLIDSNVDVATLILNLENELLSKGIRRLIQAHEDRALKILIKNGGA
jgi:chromosomal replication initiation ATPase DnaA